MISNVNTTPKTFQIIEDPHEIMKCLYFGTTIPIREDLYKYVLHDITYFDARLIILREEGKLRGNVLFFSIDESILYFGFFGVFEDDKERIEYLLDKLIIYARQHKFVFLRGPINIPAIIFGWGFMKEGSETSLYIGKPVNPPVYQKVFLSRGFYIKQEEETWEGELLENPPLQSKYYNFEDYEYFNPKSWEELMDLRKIILKLHGQNLPSSARITPNIEDVFDSYANFIFDFGYNFMFALVRYNPTNKIVASGICLPNPFKTKENGTNDSMVGFSWAVDPDHRERGVGMLMYGKVGLQARKKGIIYCSGPIESTNIASRTFAQRVGYKLKRIHLILEKTL